MQGGNPGHGGQTRIYADSSQHLYCYFPVHCNHKTQVFRTDRTERERERERERGREGHGILESFFLLISLLLAYFYGRLMR